MHATYDGTRPLAGPGMQCARLGPASRRRAGQRRRAGDRDRPRHAAGARSRESLQRGDRREALRRGRGGSAARLRSEPAVERRLRDRPGDAEGRRPHPRRPQSAARRAVVGHAHAVGRQQRGEHQVRQPHADRSADRQGRQGDRRRRSVQHVLLAGRQVGDRRGRGVQAPGLPRPAVDGAAVHAGGAALRRHQPRRLLDRRPLRDLHLRVHGDRRQDRPRRAEGRRLHPGPQARRADADGQGLRRPRRSSSARRGRACRRTSACRRTASSSSSPT